MSAGGTQRWHGGERDIWSVGKYLGLAPGSPHKGQQLPASVEARPSLPVRPDSRMVHKAPSITGPQTSQASQVGLMEARMDEAQGWANMWAELAKAPE